MGCNRTSLVDQGVLEGDRIPSLKSHGQALEQERCFVLFSYNNNNNNYYYYY